MLKDILIRQQANENVAIKCGDKSISYRKLFERAVLLANMLKGNQNFSNHVAIFIPNSIEYAVAYFAVTLSDKVIIPIPGDSKKTEIQSTIAYCDVNIIITDMVHNQLLTEYLSDFSYSVSVIEINSHIETLVKRPLQFESLSQQFTESTEDQTAIMLHTSGTTSYPKRVMLSHRNLIANICSNIESLQLTHRDRTLIQLPMFFGYCNTAQFLTHLYMGASIIIWNSMFSPKHFLQLIEKELITNFTTVPSLLLLLLHHKEKLQKNNISTLRYICFGGGTMPVDKLGELLTEYPTIGFVQTYGQTEASPRVTCLHPEFAVNKIGSVGKPIPNVKVRISKEDNTEAVSGEIGEILVQGDNVMQGYYKRPQETQGALKDGWLHTGDLGKYDEEGFIYLVGRKKNVIISGGMNIYPEELEEMLLSHPSIKEVCVVKEEHSLLGEVPIARVVLHEEADRVSEYEIKEYCFQQMTRIKVPNKIYIVKELEKTASGKVKRY